MDSIELLNELIRRGWGDVPSKDIPADWNEYPTRLDHPSAPKETAQEKRARRQRERMRQVRAEHRESVAKAAMVAESILVTDPGGAAYQGRRLNRAEKIERHAAEMRYRNTLQRFTFKRALTNQS